MSLIRVMTAPVKMSWRQDLEEENTNQTQRGDGASWRKRGGRRQREEKTGEGGLCGGACRREHVLGCVRGENCKLDEVSRLCTER